MCVCVVCECHTVIMDSCHGLMSWTDQTTTTVDGHTLERVVDSRREVTGSTRPRHDGLLQASFQTLDVVPASGLWQQVSTLAVK